jgi:hypothetical protein
LTDPKVKTEGKTAAEQGRLTVEMGVGSYEVTGARPERGTFARFVHPEGTGGAVLEAACGLGVLVEAGSIPRLAGEAHYDAASRALGRPYAEGFAYGFDGDAIPAERWSCSSDRDRTLEGYRDGRALWAAVKDGVPSPVPDFPPAGWMPETTASGVLEARG